MGITVVSGAVANMAVGAAGSTPPMDAGTDFAALLFLQLDGSVPLAPALGSTGRQTARDDDPTAEPATGEAAALLADLSGSGIPGLVMAPVAVPIGAPGSGSIDASLPGTPSPSLPPSLAPAGRSLLNGGFLAPPTALPAEPGGRISTGDAEKFAAFAGVETGESFATTLGLASQASAGAQEPPSVAAPNLPVTTAVNDNAWAGDFAQKIVWMAHHDQQAAQITLNPPQLGPVQVTVQVNGDQASATFVAPHAEVRQAIEDSLPRLREMFAAAGINLGQANVGSQFPQQGNGDGWNRGTSHISTGDNAILQGKIGPENTILPTGAIRGRGMVDLFA